MLERGGSGRFATTVWGGDQNKYVPIFRGTCNYNPTSCNVGFGGTDFLLMQDKRRPYKKNVSPVQVPLKTGNGHVAFTNLAPQTPSELYWASRAQKAEALLAAREKNYEEIEGIRQEESSKRHVRLVSLCPTGSDLTDKQIELQALEEKLREREKNLEKILVCLLLPMLKTSWASCISHLSS